MVHGPKVRKGAKSQKYKSKAEQIEVRQVRQYTLFITLILGTKVEDV